MNVDIILLTYNQEDYVRQAVESILMQRVQDDISVRVLVADDNSTDNTLEIIKDFEKKSPFVFCYLHDKKRLGLQRNYQRAFKECKGDYTLILEGDDYWCSPYHIEQHVRFLDVHRECSMSVNGIVLYWQEQSLFELNPRVSTDDVIYVNLQRQIKGNTIGNMSAICFRSVLLSLLPEKMFELDFADWLMGIVLSQYGFIALLKDYTSVYRKHSKGVWTGLSTEEQQRIIALKYSSYNELLEYKYNEMFVKAVEKPVALPAKKRNIYDYFPPIVIKVGKYLLPKALKEKMK